LCDVRLHRRWLSPLLLDAQFFDVTDEAGLVVAAGRGQLWRLVIGAGQRRLRRRYRPPAQNRALRSQTNFEHLPTLAGGIERLQRFRLLRSSICLWPLGRAGIVFAELLGFSIEVVPDQSGLGLQVAASILAHDGPSASRQPSDKPIVVLVGSPARGILVRDSRRPVQLYDFRGTRAASVSAREVIAGELPVEGGK